MRMWLNEAPWWGQLVIAGAAAGLSAFGVGFRRHQRGGRMGGAISRPKAVWLCFAIFFWFVLCPVVALDPRFSVPIRNLFGEFTTSMWLRGGVEMVMLYVTRNWRPPYGITHDASCILLIAAGMGLQWDAIQALTAPADRWALWLLAVLVVSLIVEIVHACTFQKAVEGQTMGSEGVWFASDESKRFQRINRRTTRWNVLLIGAVALFLGHYLGLLAA